jgi:hypothetical protein
MPRTSKTAADAWLTNYLRNHALDTLTPSERTQFRIACGRGAAAVVEWADATLPKYPLLWRRLKSAQRQRRFRAVPNTEKWMNDWRAAERTFGKLLTELLRRNRPRLDLPVTATPADVLRHALNALDAHLIERRGPHDALPPRSAPPSKELS